MSQNNQYSSNQSEEDDSIEFPSVSQTQNLQQKKFPMTSRDRVKLPLSFTSIQSFWFI